MTERDVKIEELMERFKFCNCGRPELALRAIRRCLQSRGDNAVEYPGDGEEWVIVYMLDAEGYLDHGDNIVAAWLTERGKELLQELRDLEL